MTTPTAIAVVLMGVTGSGKTTVGRVLAERLGWPFLDGDDYHPEANVAKMAAGTALTDEDRWPWLAVLAAEIGAHLGRGQSCLLACSALKAAYRQALGRGGDAGSVRFEHLRGSQDLIEGRLRDRVHRYMPASLLRSQFEALEAPADAATIDIDARPAEIAERIVDTLELTGSGGTRLHRVTAPREVG